MGEIGTVGKYTLRRILGKGAMGVVYEAYDPMIERTVALKTIRKDLWEDDDGEELRERFLREARAAGRLVHLGIVTVYEFGEDGGGAYIVMEHVSGRTLKELVDSGKHFWPEDAVQLITPVLAALGYSHRAGVIHRDIKPANIMVTDEGHVKILDFGVARLASANITQVGTILGTPAYMAPEQLMGQTVDARADLYSVGVILSELLTGQKAFFGDYGQVLHQVLHTDPPKPSALNDAVPPAFDTIVGRAMARHPDDRFPSAEAFIEALREAPTVLSTPILTAGGAPRAATTPASRSPMVPLAAAAALLAAAGTGAAAYVMGYFDADAPAVTAAAPTPPPARAEPKPEPVPEPIPVVAEPAPAPVIAAPPPVTAPVPVPPPEPAPAVIATPEPAAAPASTPVAAPVAAPVAEPARPEPSSVSDAIAALSVPQPDAAPKPPPLPALAVVTGRGAAPRYRTGETMEVLVSSDQTVNVYCFYQQASGEIMRVFPTRFAPNARLKPQQLLKLPGNQPFSFRFDQPQAREEVRCLASAEDLAARLPELLGGDGFSALPVASMAALAETVRQASGGRLAVSWVSITVE